MESRGNGGFVIDGGDSAGGAAALSPFPALQPGHPVIERLEDFFASPDFTGAIGDFLSKESEKFEVFDLSAEQPLEYYAVFNQYQSMIEQAVEGFLAKEGITPKQLYDICEEESGKGNSYSCLDYMVACTEYDDFLRLIADFKSMQQWDLPAGAEDGGVLGGLEDGEGLGGLEDGMGAVALEPLEALDTNGVAEPKSRADDDAHRQQKKWTEASDPSSVKGGPGVGPRTGARSGYEGGDYAGSKGGPTSSWHDRASAKAGPGPHGSLSADAGVKA